MAQLEAEAAEEDEMQRRHQQTLLDESQDEINQPDHEVTPDGTGQQPPDGTEQEQVLACRLEAY